MKSSLVRLFLIGISACEWPEPMAPGPEIPSPVLAPDGPVVITGRVTHSGTSVGLQAANIRVMEAPASVGSDETGHYQIVLPDRFVGQEIPVLVRAIGFKPEVRRIVLTRGRHVADFSLTVDLNRLSCDLRIQ